MRALLFIFASVALVLGLCKQAPAGDGKSFYKELAEGFKLGGYSSAGFNIHPGGDADAALNEISLIVSWEGDSRLRFFSELELEQPLTWQDGGSITSKYAYFDLERFYFDFNLSEKLNLRAGRFLTPAGRWNLLHAAPLVWTSTRPLVTSRMFPLSTNGALIYGAIPFRKEAFEYTVFVEAMKDQQEDRDEIEFENARGMRFSLSGKAALGLTLMEFDEVKPVSERFRAIGADFLYSHEGWEASGEIMQRFHTDGGDGGSGAYLQGVMPLGRHGAGKGWFAIGRLENFKRPAEGSSERWLIGTAWRMSPGRILKMEYVGGDDERPGSSKGFLASFAILF